MCVFPFSIKNYLQKILTRFYTSKQFYDKTTTTKQWITCFRHPRLRIQNEEKPCELNYEHMVRKWFAFCHSFIYSSHTQFNLGDIIKRKKCLRFGEYIQFLRMPSSSILLSSKHAYLYVLAIHGCTTFQEIN